MEDWIRRPNARTASPCLAFLSALELRVMAAVIGGESTAADATSAATGNRRDVEEASLFMHAHFTVVHFVLLADVH